MKCPCGSLGQYLVTGPAGVIDLLAILLPALQGPLDRPSQVGCARIWHLHGRKAEAFCRPGTDLVSDMWT